MQGLLSHEDQLNASGVEKIMKGTVRLEARAQAARAALSGGAAPAGEPRLVLPATSLQACCLLNLLSWSRKAPPCYMQLRRRFRKPTSHKGAVRFLIPLPVMHFLPSLHMVLRLA